VGEEILLKAIQAPCKTILENAGLKQEIDFDEGTGINVITGKPVDMIASGIIDPVLVTKSALKKRSKCSINDYICRLCNFKHENE